MPISVEWLAVLNSVRDSKERTTVNLVCAQTTMYDTEHKFSSLFTLHSKIKPDAVGLEKTT